MDQDWRKSTFSGNGQCVEVARDNGMVLLRDSKDPRSSRLAFTPAEWAAFTAGVKAEEFDA